MTQYLALSPTDIMDMQDHSKLKLTMGQQCLHRERGGYLNILEHSWSYFKPSSMNSKSWAYSRSPRMFKSQLSTSTHHLWLRNAPVDSALWLPFLKLHATANRNYPWCQMLIPHSAKLANGITWLWHILRRHSTKSLSLKIPWSTVVLSPFRGVRVYTRSDMEMPGSETTWKNSHAKCWATYLKRV